MPEILLHQYASSPFAEKIRVCLGIKRLAWGAVDEPVIMPKPELVALTGGYRRIPVMQIGADIYCDSQLIVRELERRFPEPTLFPAGDSGLSKPPHCGPTECYSKRQLRSFSVVLAIKCHRPLSKTARR